MTPQEKAIRNYILKTLHGCRERAHQSGHDISRLSIGCYLEIVKMADDTGAYDWDVTNYRPFSVKTHGNPSTTALMVTQAATKEFAKSWPDYRPSDIAVDSWIQEAIKAENAHPEPQPIEVSEFRQPQHFSIVHDCGGKGIMHFSLERDQISQEVLCLLQLECTSCHELECSAKASHLEQTSDGRHWHANCSARWLVRHLLDALMDTMQKERIATMKVEKLVHTVRNMIEYMPTYEGEKHCDTGSITLELANRLLREIGEK